MPTTATGYPYPDPTAPSGGAYADMRALSAAINAGALVVSGGVFIVDNTAQHSFGGLQCILPGLPGPLNGMATTNMPPGGNPRRRFGTMVRPGGPGLQVQCFNLTQPFLGNYPPSPDNVPTIPVCVVGWAPRPAIPVPPADGLMADIQPNLQAMARGVNGLGMAAQAFYTQVTPNSAGEFSVAVPGLEVVAAVLHNNRGDYSSQFNITGGLGTSTLACEAFTASPTGPDGDTYPGPFTLNAQICGLAVGYPLDANGFRRRRGRRVM